MKPDELNWGKALTVREPVAGHAERVSSVEKWLAGKLLKLLGEPNIFIGLPDGAELYNGTERPVYGFRIKNKKAFWRFIRNPSLNFGEEYSAGDIEVCGDLVEFLLAVYAKRPLPHQMSLVSRYISEGINRRRNNSFTRSKSNVHHHYDIGNDFYKKWLDRDMVYTCAYFQDEQQSLELAQRAKMEHVCRKLRLQPGETVVEAGCGWGAMALYMARHYGVKVKAYNISKQQIAEARHRAKACGMEDRVEFIEDDYRNITGTFDAFVSIGMLEHVGTSHYRGLGRVIDRVLKDDGRGLIHTIGQNEASPLSPWLVKHIFPGAYAPTLREIMHIFEPEGLAVQDVENLRLHYARTCDIWLHNFQAREDEITAMFSESFMRTWSLYLAGSVVNFQTGGMQLFQVLFTRPALNDLPLTREHLYRALNTGEGV